MQPPQGHLEKLVGVSLRLLALLVAGSACSCALWAASLEPPASSPATGDIFRSTNLLRLAIEIPEEGIQTLRHPRGRRGSPLRPRAQASVSEGGRTYTNVTVQLKGFTTYQPIDGLPSLTLNFDSLAPKQRFHGLPKISLNNSLQDATRLHEKFAREMFAAAGVPVPRADYAVVTLNGRELGLYVLTEGFDKDFLKRHFKRADGVLYEGGVLQDIDRPLEVLSGKNPTNDASVQRLISAAREPDPAGRWQALNAALDLDRFLSMVAIETMLCHSDSYSMNRNNYRLYHDPATDKFVFIPHGMDRILGTHRSNLDLSLMPPLLGLVARAVLSIPEGRSRYVERVGVLFTNLFQSDRLCRRVREIDEKILAEKLLRPADRRFDSTPNHRRDADDLCERMATRIADLKMQLAQAENLVALPLSPAFDTNGVARIDNWRTRRSDGQPEVSCQAETNEERQVWLMRTREAPLAASLRNKISLAAGDYELSGRLMVTNLAGATNIVSLRVERGATVRFAIERQRLDWRSVHLNFQIAEARSPEEIEIICDLRTDADEIRFDASSLRLIQLRK